MCAPVLFALLFTVAKMKKPPRCALIDEWIKMWHTRAHVHTPRNITQQEKEWNLLPEYYVRWNKSDRKRQIL